MDNFSSNGEDNRSIQRIIFEKANFGAFPTFFKVAGDERNHPVQWTKHPHLVEIMFSDGTTIQVTASAGSTVIEEMVGPIPNNKPEEYEVVENRLGNLDYGTLDTDPWLAAAVDDEVDTRNAPAVDVDEETPETEDAISELDKSVADSMSSLLRPATAAPADVRAPLSFIPSKNKPDSFA